MKSDWKTSEFTEKFPLGYLPVLEDGDFYLSESGAIAEYGELILQNLLRLLLGVWLESCGVFRMRPYLSYPCLNDLCREFFGEWYRYFSDLNSFDQSFVVLEKIKTDISRCFGTKPDHHPHRRQGGCRGCSMEVLCRSRG